MFDDHTLHEEVTVFPVRQMVHLKDIRALMEDVQNSYLLALSYFPEQDKEGVIYLLCFHLLKSG